MILPFLFRGKLRDVIVLKIKKDQLETEYNEPEYKRAKNGRMQPTRHRRTLRGSGSMSGKNGLHGEKFQNAWDKTFGL